MAGTDWKSALAALGTSKPAEEAAMSKQEVSKKRRAGVVYSTDPDFSYAEEGEGEEQTLPKNRQQLRVSMERSGRGGKTVTLVKGFVGTAEDLSSLSKQLKQKCGVGGSEKDGEIIIQGDHRVRLVEILKKDGYSQTK